MMMDNPRDEGPSYRGNVALYKLGQSRLGVPVGVHSAAHAGHPFVMELGALHSPADGLQLKKRIKRSSRASNRSMEFVYASLQEAEKRLAEADTYYPWLMKRDGLSDAYVSECVKHHKVQEAIVALHEFCIDRFGARSWEAVTPPPLDWRRAYTRGWVTLIAIEAGNVVIEFIHRGM